MVYEESTTFLKYKIDGRQPSFIRCVYRVGDFIFSCKQCYEYMKEIDRDADNILSDLGDDEDMKEFFDKIDNILVYEKYFNTYLKMMDLFPNIKQMLRYYSYGENIILKKKYEFARMFLRKFSFTGQ